MYGGDISFRHHLDDTLVAKSNPICGFSSQILNLCNSTVTDRQAHTLTHRWTHIALQNKNNYILTSFKS